MLCLNLSGRSNMFTSTPQHINLHSHLDHNLKRKLYKARHVVLHYPLILIHWSVFMTAAGWRSWAFEVSLVVACYTKSQMCSLLNCGPHDIWKTARLNHCSKACTWTFRSSVINTMFGFLQLRSRATNPSFARIPQRLKKQLGKLLVDVASQP